VLTNNATKSRKVYAKKLAKLGYPEKINQDSIVNPAAVVADTLHRSGIQRQNKKVYLIGAQGIKDELENVGIEYFGDGPDYVENQESSKGSAFLFDIELEEEVDQVGAVVLGVEKHFNYCKLMKVS
jgi:ribonucleotide monophosphatase NagD (HAD superfamily)